MPAPQQTDAEKLAAAKVVVAEAHARIIAAQEAEAPIVAAAIEQSKAILLPYAEAAVAVMSSPEAVAFAAALQAHVDTSLDDLPRPAGVPGAEGTKQMVQRTLTSLTNGLIGARNRVATLQAAPIPAVPVIPAPTATEA